MKTRFFIFSALTSFLLMIITVSAQDRLDFGHSLIAGADPETSAPSVVSNFTLSGTVIGLEAGYEQRLGRHTSLSLRGGYHSAVVAGEIRPDSEDVEPYYTKSPYGSHAYAQINETTMYFASRPGLSLEWRYYTSLDRRARKGKKTEYNSANFVALRAGSYHLPRNRDSISFDLKAMYGIRRVFGRHFFIEPVFGIGYNFYVDHSYPIINGRFGFAF